MKQWMKYGLIVVVSAVAAFAGGVVGAVAFDRPGPRGAIGPAGPPGDVGPKGETASLPPGMGVCWDDANRYLTTPVILNGAIQCLNGQYIPVVPQPYRP